MAMNQNQFSPAESLRLILATPQELRKVLAAHAFTKKRSGDRRPAFSGLLSALPACE